MNQTTHPLAEIRERYWQLIAQKNKATERLKGLSDGLGRTSDELREAARNNDQEVVEKLKKRLTGKVNEAASVRSALQHTQGQIESCLSAIAHHYDQAHKHPTVFLDWHITGQYPYKVKVSVHLTSLEKEWLLGYLISELSHFSLSLDAYVPDADGLTVLMLQAGPNTLKSNEWVPLLNGLVSPTALVTEVELFIQETLAQMPELA